MADIQVNVEGSQVDVSTSKGRRWRRVDRDYEQERVFEAFRIEQDLNVDDFESVEDLEKFMDMAFKEHDNLKHFNPEFSPRASGEGMKLVKQEAVNWYEEEKGMKEVTKRMEAEERETKAPEVEVPEGEVEERREMKPEELGVPERRVEIEKPQVMEEIPATISEAITGRIREIERGIEEKTTQPQVEERRVEVTTEAPTISESVDQRVREVERTTEEATRPDIASRVGRATENVTRAVINATANVFRGIGRLFGRRRQEE